MNSIAGGRLLDASQARPPLPRQPVESHVARKVDDPSGDERARISRISNAPAQSAHAVFSYGRGAVPDSPQLPGSYVDTYA